MWRNVVRVVTPSCTTVASTVTSTSPSREMAPGMNVKALTTLDSTEEELICALAVRLLLSARAVRSRKARNGYSYAHHLPAEDGGTAKLPVELRYSR
ncbi:hypothetical protein STCU_10079 [Strigomonas culicis]|uniref:Uncharacterized protein n=1 Tax=Strigomonas culicis TaxID=28005 RepID=S9UUT3_9TRYP|nr:hypothetical protein STCU_10079 [Strigomonas culicis]|eukprot:EPY18281.1 hypothetical protein STCU_10079 [Strigomonas culicis]